ncbi:hypothetical protein M2158_008582 [Streptomyces sp. SAI-144]|nr:hypothetical protein [Streptomyces sp. SAI-144]
MPVPRPAGSTQWAISAWPPAEADVNPCGEADAGAREGARPFVLPPNPPHTAAVSLFHRSRIRPVRACLVLGQRRQQGRASGPEFQTAGKSQDRLGVVRHVAGGNHRRYRGDHRRSMTEAVPGRLRVFRGRRRTVTRRPAP